MSDRRYALMAGGGTAGHLQPALAIAEALVDRGHERSTIEFVGSSRGQDRVALAGRGFPVTLLPGRGIARSLRPAVLVQNVGAVLGLAAAGVLALGLVWRRRPEVVVSVGGYASLAASVAAVLLRVPLVLVNVDAVPGAANRLLARFAAACAVGWDDTPLPRAVVTGTPVRPAIAAVGRDDDARRAARLDLGLPPDRPTVVVFGGSLGARRINGAADGLVARWSGRPDRSVYQIVGRRDWDAAPPAPADDPAPADGVAVLRVPYEERMDLAYAAADVVVCRAGAMTVAELSVAGVPAVLVPLPGAPGDHQTANARVLERAGAAVLLPDAECTGDRLATILDGLFDDPTSLTARGRAARAVGHPDAAEAGARVVEASTRRPPVRVAP